jgi:NADH-quinone oxidoreductase subunit N
MIHAPSIHYLAITPELIFLGAAFALLAGAGLSRRVLSATVGAAVSTLAVIASVIVNVVQWHDVAQHGATVTIAKAVIQDGFSVLASAVIAIGAGLSAWVMRDYLNRDRHRATEFYVLALSAVSGALLMVQANDLIVVFLGLEILSLGLYVLVGFDRRRSGSNEAALKYFLLGGFASALFIYGAALLYGATGTTSLTGISYFLSTNTLLRPGLVAAGSILLLVALAFKVAAAPFHMWSPDTYDGAPSPVTGFMAAIVKVGAVGVLLRLFLMSLPTQTDLWHPVLYVIVIATLVVGSLVGLVQRSVKRLLAYSSINHAGFILLGLFAGGTRGVEGSLYYLVTYVPVVIATFAIVTLVGGRGDTNHELSAYRGLARRQPVLGGTLAVLLLVQAGAPFTTGFFAKLSVITAAVSDGGIIVSVIAMAAAAAAGYYYLRTVLSLFAADEPFGESIAVPVGSASVIALGASSAVIFGVWTGPLVSLAHHATLLLP